MVPRLFPGSTIVCIGGGPSLTRDDVELTCARAPVVAINDAWKLIPHGKTDAILFACDHKWWRWNEGVPSFTGLKYTLEHGGRRHRLHWPDVHVLRNTGDRGLELDPSGLRTGRNSGFQAIGIAVHLGASRIILLGYDLQVGAKGEHHWFGMHPDRVRPPLSSFRPYFDTLVKPLRELNIEIVNCSRRSALTCFPTMSLEDALASAREVAA